MSAFEPTEPKAHAGWFKVPEEALRVIARSFEEPSAYRAAVLAYITLCRKANLKGGTTFEDRMASMAIDMGFHYREARRALVSLETLGLVSIYRRQIAGSKENLPSLYTVKGWEPLAPTPVQEAPTSGEDEAKVTSPQLSQELPKEPSQEHPSIVSDGTGRGFAPGPDAGEAFRQARMEAGLVNKREEAA